MSGYRIVERDGRDKLGEGPVWVASEQAVYWVDILGQRLHRLALETGVVAALDMGEAIGWALPQEGTSDLVIGLKSGIATLDFASGAVTMRGDPEPDRPHNRLNDAKIDRAGRIWFGSKDDGGEEDSGALYRLDPGFAWKRMDDGYGVTNGPTFSPDGFHLFHTDSPRRTIYLFDCHDDRTLWYKRPHIVFDEAWGYPDGMTTDAEGCLWVAHWAGGRVTRFDPTGQPMRHIDLPASNITSCTFAGERLDRMFVTSSYDGHEDEPHAGALFEVDPGVTGLPTGAYRA